MTKSSLLAPVGPLTDIHRHIRKIVNELIIVPSEAAHDCDRVQMLRGHRCVLIAMIER